jgi:NAD(P)-dependent dehydrogenase (short-subunit alcohol dehydrogenase family)
VLDVNVKGARDTIEAFLPLMPAKSAQISLVSSEVGAWYLAELDETTRETFTNADKVDWTTTEARMKDWAEFAQGKPAEIKWAPVDKAYNQAYSTSKALLTSWARGWAKRNPDYKLAVVCPGYCATGLNGFSGYRHASVGGESVTWPLLNEFESGEFYQDGKKLAIVQQMPDAMKSLFEKNSSQ